MMVKCGINGEDLQENEILVCHHCGMPVCRTHGWVATSDDAFAESVEASPERPVGALLPPLAGRLAPAQPARGAVPGAAHGTAVGTLPSAVHCRDCADRFHRKVSRRAGRTDSRLRTAGPAASAGQP